jgi:hypothetical protein
MPESIPYIAVDLDKPVFAAPEIRYSFDMPSHTFIGQSTELTGPDGTSGLCSIVAQFNYAGELEHGSVKVVGQVSSLGVSDESTLIQGSIINVDRFVEGGVFRANFLFRIQQDHPALELSSHIGVWNAYMQIPGWPEFYLRYLFRRTWGPAIAPLNSYVGQVGRIV